MSDALDGLLKDDLDRIHPTDLDPDKTRARIEELVAENKRLKEEEKHTFRVLGLMDTTYPGFMSECIMTTGIEVIGW